MTSIVSIDDLYLTDEYFNLRNYLLSLNTNYIQRFVSLLNDLYVNRKLNERNGIYAKLLLLVRSTNDYIIARNNYKQLIKTLNIDERDDVKGIDKYLIDNITHINDSFFDLTDSLTRRAIKTLLLIE